MTRITEVEVRDVMRVRYARVEPTGSMTVVGGDNSQGKSSFLDAICFALGGARLCPERPIRDGADKAEVSLILEADEERLLPRTKVVRRWVRMDDGSVETRLDVFDADDPAEDEDKQRAAAPQTLLNDLLSRAAFDPLEFARMERSHRTERLLAELGADFSVVDELIEEAFEDRKIKKKEYSAACQDFAAAPHHEGAGTNIVSLSELSEQLAAASRQEAELSAANAAVASARAAEVSAGSGVEMIDQQIARLEEQLKGLREDREAGLAAATEAAQATNAALSALSNFPEMADVSAIEAEIREAEDRNAKVRENVDRDRKAKVVEEKAESLKEAEYLLKSHREAKAAAIGKIKWPIEGLSIDPESHDLMYQGIPFDQASSSEQLRISAAIGLANNPSLKLLIVREGALLDSNSLVSLAELAAENGGQVFVERVGEGGECNVVMRDGIMKLQDHEAGHAETT